MFEALANFGFGLIMKHSNKSKRLNQVIPYVIAAANTGLLMAKGVGAEEAITAGVTVALKTTGLHQVLKGMHKSVPVVRNFKIRGEHL